MRKTGKNLLLAGGLALLTTTLAGGVTSFRAWQREELSRTLSGGRVVETALGPVEYQLTGQGPAVIYAHGTPGGYDQGLAFARFLGGTLPCTFISPSRPGYLRTPVTSGASPEAQADLYAALLDELGIEQACIIGFSGGGPSALQFALRHPDRCRGVVMIGGVVQRNCWRERTQALPTHKRLAAYLVEYLLISDPFLYLVLPLARALPAGSAVAGMLCSGALYHLRKTGYENDRAHFASLSNYPLEKITAPVLVIHGTHDEDVPYEDAQLLVRTASNVTLLALSGGDHSAFYTHARTVMPKLRAFLSS